MRWKGLALASPRQPGWLPGRAHGARRPPVPGTRSKHRLPGPPRVPGFPRVAPFPAAEPLLLPPSALRNGKRRCIRRHRRWLWRARYVLDHRRRTVPGRPARTAPPDAWPDSPRPTRSPPPPARYPPAARTRVPGHRGRRPDRLASALLPGPMPVPHSGAGGPRQRRMARSGGQVRLGQLPGPPDSGRGWRGRKDLVEVSGRRRGRAGCGRRIVRVMRHDSARCRSPPRAGTPAGCPRARLPGPGARDQLSPACVRLVPACASPS
jgi:hypothetical protein